MHGLLFCTIRYVTVARIACVVVVSKNLRQGNETGRECEIKPYAKETKLGGSAKNKEYFSPIFHSSQACSFARLLFRSLVRSSPGKGNEMDFHCKHKDVGKSNFHLSFHRSTVSLPADASFPALLNVSGKSPRDEVAPHRGGYVVHGDICCTTYNCTVPYLRLFALLKSFNYLKSTCSCIGLSTCATKGPFKERFSLLK